MERRAEPRSRREPWPGGLLSGAFDLGGSLQGYVLLLESHPGTFGIQKVLVGRGLKNARHWPWSGPGNSHLAVPPALYLAGSKPDCASAVALDESLPFLCLTFFICEMGRRSLYPKHFESLG